MIQKAFHHRDTEDTENFLCALCVSVVYRFPGGAPCLNL